MGSAQSWGNKFLSITTSCPQPQLSLPWVHVRERFVTDLCFSAKLLFPATAHLPKHRGRWRRDERTPVVFIYHGFSPDVSLWGGSWESWRGSELPYQNLQRWMSQREGSLAQEVGRQGPRCSSVSFPHCYLSRAWFCNSYSFCARGREAHRAPAGRHWVTLTPACSVGRQGRNTNRPAQYLLSTKGFPSPLLNTKQPG